MSVCVAAYMTESALKFLENNVATKVSNYKTSLYEEFSHCVRHQIISKLSVVFMISTYVVFFFDLIPILLDFAKYLTTAVATAEEDVVLVALPLTHLSNKIFRIFKLLKMFKLFPSPTCPMKYSEYSKC